jgi:ribosomal protein L7/L12
MDDSARLNALQLKVADLERKLNFVLDQLHLQYSAAPLTPAQAEAANWLRQGNKIEAIKAHQKLSGLGLKEAKDAVEALEQKLNSA